MSGLESDRRVKRSGSTRAAVSRSRLAARVERVLGVALSGERHVTLDVQADDLLADATGVAAAIRAVLDRAGPSLRGQLRVTQPFKPGGLADDLVNSLVHPDPKIRVAAARLCGALRLVDAVPWIGDLTTDSNAGVRDAAIRALGRCRGGRAVDILMSNVDRVPQYRLAIELSRAASDMDIEALLRQPASVQAAVVTVLACGLRKDSLRISPLLGIACDQRWPGVVRAAACRALAMIGDPATADRVRRLMTDPEADVRAAATKAQRRLDPQGPAGPA